MWGSSLDRVLLAVALVGRARYLVEQADDELSVMPLLVSVGDTCVHCDAHLHTHFIFERYIHYRWLFLLPALH